MNPAVPETGKGTGAIIDREDPRDFSWTEVGFGAPPFDWNLGFDIEEKIGSKIPAKDQDGSFSCGGQAWASYAAVLEAVFTGTFEERSAKFIYAQTFVPPDGGSMGRSNADIFVNQGVAREVLTSSYDLGAPPKEAFMRRVQDVSEAARYDAKNDKALSYSNVDVTIGIDVIAQAIRENYGAVIGLAGQNNGTWASAFPAPPTNGPYWFHWVYAGKAKMINGVKHIGFLNSWGKTVGQDGWQWLSEAYVKKLLPSSSYRRALWQVWTHSFNPTAIPPFTHNFKTNIKLLETGSEVIALQRALQIDGQFPKSVPCTGYYGDITRRAVLAFQLKYSVASTQELFALNGEQVGAKTRMKLNQLFNTI